MALRRVSDARIVHFWLNFPSDLSQCLVLSCNTASKPLEDAGD